jgi:hypothetical protein
LSVCFSGPGCFCCSAGPLIEHFKKFDDVHRATLPLVVRANSIRNLTM